MKKMVFYSLLFVIMMILSPNEGHAAEFWDSKHDVDPFHTFTITFNDEVNESTIKGSLKEFKGIFIVSGETGEEVDVSFTLSKDKKAVMVHPPVSGYEDGVTYTMHIREDVKSSSGKTLMEAVIMMFDISDKQYVYLPTFISDLNGGMTAEEVKDLLNAKPQYILKPEYSSTDRLEYRVNEFFTTGERYDGKSIAVLSFSEKKGLWKLSFSDGYNEILSDQAFNDLYQNLLHAFTQKLGEPTSISNEEVSDIYAKSIWVTWKKGDEQCSLHVYSSEMYGTSFNIQIQVR